MSVRQRLRSWTIVILAVGAVVLVAATDYLGFVPSLSFFSVVPISLVGWFVSWRAGTLLSAASVMAWLATDLLAAYPDANPLAPYLIAVIRFGLFSIVTVILTMIKQVLEREKGLARTDPLTGVSNTRLFSELADAELNRARRYAYPFALAYVDLDNFKTVNDRFGHNTGDALLQVVTATMKNNLRAVDIIARLGGDEFAILLPEATADTAPGVLHKLRRELLNVMERNHWPVTFSIGLMTFVNPPPSVQEMIRLTDALMYEAKHSGKNMVRHDVWTGGPSPVTQPGAVATPANPPRSFGPWMRAAVLPLYAYRRRTWLLGVAGLVVLTILAVGTIAAVNDSLPGSSLYTVKRETENLQRVFARSPEGLVRVHLRLADRRLSEMASLLRGVQTNAAAQTALAYESELEAILAAVQSQPAAMPSTLLKQVGEHLLDQQNTLRAWEARLSPADRPLIQHSLSTNQSVLAQLEANASAAAVATVVANQTPAAGSSTLIATVTTMPIAAFAPTATDVAVPAATAEMGVLPVVPTMPDPRLTASPSLSPQPTNTLVPGVTVKPLPTFTQTPIPRATATPVPPASTATPTPVVIYRPADATATQAPTATPSAIPTIFHDKILFLSDRDRTQRVYVMNPDGSHVGMLTNRWAYDAAVSEQTLGANGALRVVVLGNLKIGTKIAVTGRTSGQPSVVFENNAINYDPAFAPDGYNIAYISIVSGADEIYRINRDGRGFVQLTTGATWQWNKKPSWSSDGKSIIWWSNRDTGRKQIWIMNADGSNVRNLSNNEFNNWDPVWVR